MNNMDEDFALFLEHFGPAIDRRYVPPSTIARYRGKLPDQLLAYWEEYGWCGYADGLFWTVNPQEYEPVLEAWIGETPFMEQDAYHVIARSAFGTLYLWGERTGGTLRIFAPASWCFASTPDDDLDLDFEMRLFFGGLSRATNDVEDLFAPALQRLGRLTHDDMYGFVPALALGGAPTLANLQKVKAVEHLVILAQFSPLQVTRIPTL
jgi:hypothetical protein